MERELLRVVLEQVDAGVYVVGLDGGITTWSPGAERITGYTAREVLGRPCSAGILVHLDDTGARMCHSGGCPVCVAPAAGEAGPTRVLLQHRHGHRVPARTRATLIRDEGGAPVGVVVVFTDDSTGLALCEEVERLRAAALLDPLTGIGNRRFGERGLVTMLDEMRRYGWPFGAVLLDLDDFKLVNDAYGHPVGDRVLVAVARTLAGSVRTFDVVARWGGDEFLVLLANLTGEELRHKAAALCAYVGESSVSTPAGTVNVTASVGATLAAPGDSPESLVERADREMYRAKGSGRNRASLDGHAPPPVPP